RRPHQPRPHGAGDDLGDLRARRHHPADPEVDPVRRGPGRRPLHPGHHPQAPRGAGLPRGRGEPRRPGGRALMARPHGRRRAVPARGGAHRAPRARMRWGRLAAALSAAAVTLVTIGAGIGLGPTGGGEAAHAEAVVPDAPRVTRTVPTVPAVPTPAPEQVAHDALVARRTDTRLPANSGSGRRVVFDADRQRVWLVAGGRGERSRVLRTYLVSGSTLDNLQPGRYEVWSRSRHATAIDDAGTMRWMVRFARGERAAIGFHD